MIYVCQTLNIISSKEEDVRKLALEYLNRWRNYLANKEYTPTTVTEIVEKVTYKNGLASHTFKFNAYGGYYKKSVYQITYSEREVL